MKTILTLRRPVNRKHRRARMLCIMGLQSIALWAISLAILWIVASR